MSSNQNGQITSANDAGNVPSADGFLPGGDFNLLLAGGTTIDAELQIKTDQDNWVLIPDSSTNTRTTLAGATAIKVKVDKDKRVRIAVTTATGTWDYEFSSAIAKVKTLNQI